MVRLVILHTTYTVDRVYDLDHGLTYPQLEFLCEGIVEKEVAAQGRALETMAYFAMCHAAATAAGMTGQFQGFNLARKDTLELATRLQDFRLSHMTEATSPSTMGATGQRHHRMGPPVEMPDVLVNHPLFTKNLGFGLND